MLKTFADLAVDVDMVLAVSRKVQTRRNSLSGDDTHDQSMLLLKTKEGGEVVIEISEAAATSLIEHLKTREAAAEPIPA